MDCGHGVHFSSEAIRIISPAWPDYCQIVYRHLLERAGPAFPMTIALPGHPNRSNVPATKQRPYMTEFVFPRQQSHRSIAGRRNVSRCGAASASAATMRRMPASSAMTSAIRPSSSQSRPTPVVDSGATNPLPALDRNLHHEIETRCRDRKPGFRIAPRAGAGSCLGLRRRHRPHPPRSARMKPRRWRDDPGTGRKPSTVPPPAAR